MTLMEEFDSNALLVKAKELNRLVSKIAKRAEYNYYKFPTLNQLVRSANSVYANGAELHKFLTAKFRYSKMNISYGEARESLTHCVCLNFDGVITDEELEQLTELLTEITKIQNKSLQTLAYAVSKEKGRGKSDE